MASVDPTVGDPVRILAVGDSYMPPIYFREAFDQVASGHSVEYLQVDDSRPFEPSTPSDLRLREYEGAPTELAQHMAGVEVLVVHGAPVTAELLDCSRVLRLVCCARGGPVNVDVEAVSARGLPLVNTPGKNAEAVADLTLAFMVMMGRGLPRAQRFLDEGNQLKSNWDGARFIGGELRNQTLGLIGYGQVGHRVATRAVAFGMTVLAYDPYVEAFGAAQPVATVDELLERSNYISLHARSTPETENLLGPAAFARLKPGSFLINTARETLVDEDALDAALVSGRLAGAALDVVRKNPTNGRHRLLRHDNVVLTPHIGGATHETLRTGAEMIAAEITRFVSGQPLINIVNRPALSV